MFWTVFPSIIRYCYLLASKQVAVSVWHIPVAVCTVLNSWWWTERLSETRRVLFKNKFEKLVHLFGFTLRIIQGCCMELEYLWCAFVCSDVKQHIIECMLKCETSHSPMSSAQIKIACYVVPWHHGNGTLSLVSDCDVFSLIIVVINFYINDSVRGLNLESFWTLKLHVNV
jgi:hypothetical protein